MADAVNAQTTSDPAMTGCTLLYHGEPYGTFCCTSDQMTAAWREFIEDFRRSPECFFEDLEGIFRRFLSERFEELEDVFDDYDRVFWIGPTPARFKEEHRNRGYDL